MSGQPRLHIVLHQPEIAPNTGNIGRTCVALGAKLWLVRPLGFRLSESNLRRAGLDYWQHLDHEIVDCWDDLTQRLDTSEAWYLTKTAMRAYTDAMFREGDILVFGSETQGLPPSVLQSCPERSLAIPMQPQVRSLNLATSVGIVAYEALRQIDGR